ncbi:MAG: 50S ribosomal protein L5 [Candidatus Omnitrophica bacterium]|nr:50S ribosomal protein L5 [Candidatus Omnitrophota bacterium]
MTNKANTPRLLEKYKTEVVPKMMEQFAYKNKMQAPKVKKVVLNVGLGIGAQDIKPLEAAAQELAIITGQKAVITRAKKAISNFKIRKGSAVGCKVTLRRIRMYEFLDRLLNVAIPRVKDFRGLSRKSFDKNFNYSFGITEQIIFPEIEYDTVFKIHGMDITINTDAGSSEEAFELLRLLGVPFRKK